MSGGGGGGGGGLMSCVREGSLEPPAPYRPPNADSHSHGEGRTGRFLRGLRRMFKRRGSGTRADASPDPKSSSTSELLDAERSTRRKEGAYGSGLSVSHDSVFTGERSGDESSDERPTPAHGLGHIVTSHRAELVAAVRRRGRGDGSDDEEDLGLPRSPPASPPTDKVDKTREEMPVKRPPRRKYISAIIKRHHAGISQSSCSDGSLLSVGSSEMDDDSSSGHHHSHDHSTKSDHSDLYNSSEPPTGVAPLSHSAAKHKMAVRPRRTHGAPRRKKNNPIVASALPITPELNEEMIRSTTPEISYKSSEVFTESFSSSTTTKHQVIVKEQHQLVNKELHRVLETPNDTKLKSSSLPPGLALNQLVGQSPTKLSLAESNTPRSSIKRSQSSSQGQSLRDCSPKTKASTSETKIHIYNSEEKITKHRTDKHADESCHEKKSKSDKKIENDVIRSSRKEFFSRWLLRKSGKKTKKDQTDGESQQEVKKSKSDKVTAQYKVVDADSSSHSVAEQGLVSKPVPAERTSKTAGQKVFANQMHKRLDNKGAYIQEGVYRDSYSTTKVTGAEYKKTDLKTTEETDKILNQEIKNRFSRQELNEKIEKSKRTSHKEAVEDNKRESFNLQLDRSKRPASVQRLVDPFSSKAFIKNEIENINKEETMLPSLTVLEEESPIKAVKVKKPFNDNAFHSGSMPKNIPYFNPSLEVCEKVSSAKTVLHQSTDDIKTAKRSSGFQEFPEFREKQVIESKREKSYQTTKTEESYVKSGLRSLGDEFVETRSSIGKSHSFRYASETSSISSHDSQMPSLPAIVGISENWDVNYRKSVSDRRDHTKRVSARNYNIVHGTAESNFDSLPSTDSSYMDSLKTDAIEERKHFTNSIHITLDSNKRDSDISQIEAKIDDIISSPKPLISPMLKTNSLESLKSSPEKIVEDRRKTISVESALGHHLGHSTSSSINFKDSKPESDCFVSVTHINKDQIPVTVTANEPPKTNKIEEKLQKSGTSKPGVPEFLFLQLNKVDPKPTTNIVLTANVLPKKIDSPQADKEIEIQNFEVSETKSTHNIQIRRESVVTNKFVENITDNTQSEVRFSPIVSRRSVIQPVVPQSPKPFFKKKSFSVDKPDDKPEKPRTNSMSTEGSIEKINDNISMDQKSFSSFGSKSSIQSTDSSEIRTPDRHEETVLYRKKPALSREIRRNDDEPELMKVFARRSLKIKDSDADSIAKDIAEKTNRNEKNTDNTTDTRTKTLKNEFNASIKSRDSDKENEDTVSKDQSEENKALAIAARISQFGNLGASQYQRSVSINSVSNPKRESAPPNRSEVNKYKKEVADSTPEKRLRNRTFPDLSNDREELKKMVRNEAISNKDTLTKRSWQKRDDERLRVMDKERRASSVIERDSEMKNGEEKSEKGAEAEADDALQFKCIFERRAEWEKRAQQGMTK